MECHFAKLCWYECQQLSRPESVCGFCEHDCKHIGLARDHLEVFGASSSEIWWNVLIFVFSPMKVNIGIAVTDIGIVTRQIKQLDCCYNGR